MHALELVKTQPESVIALALGLLAAIAVFFGFVCAINAAQLAQSRAKTKKLTKQVERAATWMVVGFVFAGPASWLANGLTGVIWTLAGVFGLMVAREIILSEDVDLA